MTSPTVLQIPTVRRDPALLRTLAAAGARELDGADARTVLQWAFTTFGARCVVAASMGDTVLAHLASQVRPGVELLFLDTGYHFAETLGTADAVAAVYDVTLTRAVPPRTVAQQDAEHGPRLYERDPDLCCALRKVAPLRAALAGRDAWITGLRRAEAATRVSAREVEWDAGRGLVKVNPLVSWSDEEVDAYIDRHEVLTNPLLADGYASVGCAPCTRRVAAGEDTRAGRWAGTGKVECGIHA